MARVARNTQGGNSGHDDMRVNNGTNNKSGPRPNISILASFQQSFVQLFESDVVSHRCSSLRPHALADAVSPPSEQSLSFGLCGLVLGKGDCSTGSSNNSGHESQPWHE